MLGFINPKHKGEFTNAGPTPHRNIVNSSWENITTPVTSGAGHENHRGSAWCDYDNDGLLDL